MSRLKMEIFITAVQNLLLVSHIVLAVESYDGFLRRQLVENEKYRDCELATGNSLTHLTHFLFVCTFQAVITYFLIGFQADFAIFYATTYSLAMASTALGVMLGSAVENPKLGQEFLPVLFVPQMLFAGFFVAPKLIPIWLRWARFICTMTFAFRIIMVAEFDRCCGSVLSLVHL